MLSFRSIENTIIIFPIRRRRYSINSFYHFSIFWFVKIISNFLWHGWSRVEVSVMSRGWNSFQNHNLIHIVSLRPERSEHDRFISFHLLDLSARLTKSNFCRSDKIDSSNWMLNPSLQSSPVWILPFQVWFVLKQFQEWKSIIFSCWYYCLRNIIESNSFSFERIYLSKRTCVFVEINNGDSSNSCFALTFESDQSTARSFSRDQLQNQSYLSNHYYLCLINFEITRNSRHFHLDQLPSSFCSEWLLIDSDILFLNVIKFKLLFFNVLQLRIELNLIWILFTNLLNFQRDRLKITFLWMKPEEEEEEEEEEDRGMFHIIFFFFDIDLHFRFISIDNYSRVNRSINH